MCMDDTISGENFGYRTFRATKAFSINLVFVFLACYYCEPNKMQGSN